MKQHANKTSSISWFFLLWLYANVEILWIKPNFIFGWSGSWCMNHAVCQASYSWGLNQGGICSKPSQGAGKEGMGEKKGHGQGRGKHKERKIFEGRKEENEKEKIEGVRV